MKRMALLALALVLALALSGCAQDESARLESVAVRVGSIEYTYADVLEAEAANREYYAQLYGADSLPVTDEELRSEVVNNLAVQAVVLDKAHQMGLTQLTDEEKREISRSTTARMNEYRAAAAAALTLPEGATDAEREAAVDAALAEDGVTREKVYRSEWEAFIIEKTQDWAVGGVTVSDAEFMADFSDRAAQQRQSMDADANQYGMMMLVGETPLYAPAGYRMMDWLYIASPDENVAQLSAISAAHSAAHEDALACEEAARGLLGEEADVDALAAQVNVTLAEVTDPAAITVQEAVMPADPALSEEASAAVIALAKARALDAAYEEQLTLATEAANAAITPEVEEALRRLENGESWELVQAHYNDDVDMYYGSPVVCADFAYAQPAYVDAAMALTAPGEWSQGVYDEGYGCFILLYSGDVAQGQVDPESVREELTAELLTTKRDATFSETLDLWIDAASYTIFINYELLGF